VSIFGRPAPARVGRGRAQARAEGSEKHEMRITVQAFFTGRPLWVTVPVIVATSIAASLGALFMLVELLGQGYGPTFTRSLTIAIVAPTLVSAPIGGFIVHLLREVERARLQAQTLAWHDELTGLLNRRRFSELGRREFALAHRGGRRLAAVLIDIDDFKRINDHHGHAAGDEVLRAIGRTLVREVRGTDLVARWGGEEFAMLLPDTGADELLGLCERVRSAIMALRVPVPEGAELACTASIGLTEARAGDSFDSCLDRADQAMYRAKFEGKNRVVVQRA
jgi:diguanylate cyclase